MGLTSPVFPMRFQLGPIAHGVLDCTIANAHEHAEMRLSNLDGDALKDFLEAVIALLIHEDTFIWCHWYDEPPYYSWIMRHEKQELSISICHDDLPIRTESPPLKLVLFQTKCHLDDFLIQVQVAYQQLFIDYGLAGYYERWGYSFPLESIEHLHREIKLHRPHNSLPDTVTPKSISSWAFLLDRPQIPIEDREQNLSQSDMNSIATKTTEQLLRALCEPNRHDKKTLLSALLQKRNEIAPEFFDKIELSLLDLDSLPVIIRVLGESSNQRFLPYLETLLQKCPTFPVASNIVSSIEKLVTLETSYKLFEVFRYNDAKGYAYNLWRNIARKIAKMGPDALPMIKDALCSTHENVRAYAAQILGIIGGNTAYAYLLDTLYDASANVRIQVIQALVIIKQKEIIPLLHEKLSDDDGSVRACIFQSLQDLEDDQRLTLSYQFVTDTYWHVRYLCGYIMAQIDRARSIPTLLQLTKDPEYAVRSLAISMLGKVGEISLLKGVQSQIEATEPLEFGGNDLRCMIRKIIEKKQSLD